MKLSQVHDDSDDCNTARPQRELFFSFPVLDQGPGQTLVHSDGMKDTAGLSYFRSSDVHSGVIQSEPNTHAVQNLHLLAELCHTALHCNENSSSQMVLLQHPGILAQPVSSGPYCV